MNSAVSEVYNSLDAKATSIAIRVDIEQNKIQVIDNGHGITENDFDVLGQKYMTSKCIDLNTLKSLPNTYGYRGQSLANIISISQKVKITSRCENNEDTWFKIFYNRKLRELAKTTARPSVGTTVEITGLFYNLHIQNKAVDALGELNDIKAYLKQLALVHTNISISLRDDSKNDIIFQLYKNRDVYQTLKLLFDVESSNIQEFKVEKNKYKVTAYIGKKNKEINNHQWIYLNMKYLKNSKLHKLVNDNLLKFLKNGNKRKVIDKIADNEEVVQAKCNIPFYIIIISCPYYDYDIYDESKQTTIEFKDWQNITKLLEKLIKFYTGDENLKKQLKPKTIAESKRKEIEKKDDTRDQVRKIVEKLLKSGRKKLGVSQMQNVVKGKLTKRKFKKRPTNISLSKVIPPKNSTKFEQVNQNSITSERNVDNEIMTHRNIPQNSNINKRPKKRVPTIRLAKKIISDSEGLSLGLEKNVPKQAQKTRKHICLKNNKKSINRQSKIKTPLPVSLSVKSKQDKEKHFITKMNEVIKSPQVISPSFGSKINRMQRCLQFENKYKNVEEDLTNGTEHRNKGNHKISVHERIQFSNIVNSSKNVSIRKRIEEVIVYDYIPHHLNPSSCDNYKQNQYNNNIRLNNRLVSSHDLVKTILNSQYHVTNPRNRITDNYNEHLQPHYFEPSIKLSNQVSHKVFTSRLTYESHDYNKKDIAQKLNGSDHNLKRQFITKQSRDNFLDPTKTQRRKTLNNNKLKTKVKKTFHDTKLNINTGFKILKSNLQESSYIIDFSESSDNKSKLKTQQTVNTPRFSPNDRENFSIQLNIDQKEVLNSDELRTENMTRSKLGNTYHNVSCISEVNTNSHYFERENNDRSRYDLQATYTINKNGNNDMENVSDYLPNEQNHLNFVFLSKSQTTEVNETFENIDPLDVCNAILSNNSIDVTKDEFSFNLSGINLNDSLFNFDLNVLNNDSVKNACTIHKSDEIESTHISQQKIKATNSNKNDTNNETQTVDMEEMETPNQEITIHEDITAIGKTGIDKEKDIWNSFNLKNRLNFIPKGMSQIFEKCNTRTACEYNFEDEYFENILYSNFANNVQIHTEVFEPRIKDVTDVADTKIEKINTKLHKENASLIFDGISLKQAKVLGQIDGKFIAAILKAKSNSLHHLVLFDQHALHERIRLEKNLSDYLGENAWNSISLDNISLNLSKDEILYLHNYKEKFAQFGLQWDVVNNTEVTVNAIPKAILGKNPRQAEKVIEAVKNLILEEISILKTQRGCISLYPRAIMELVFSEACRYAIKFGDKLTTGDCVDLLHSLSECKTPFQCAHGRPVMAVILELFGADNSYEYKVDISKVLAFHKKCKK